MRRAFWIRFESEGDPVPFDTVSYGRKRGRAIAMVARKIRQGDATNGVPVTGRLRLVFCLKGDRK